MQVQWETVTIDALRDLRRDVISRINIEDPELHEKFLLVMAILRDLSFRHEEDFPLRIKSVQAKV